MKKSGAMIVLSIFSFFLLSAPAAAQQVSLTIFHTNDTHGHLLPFSYPAEVDPGSALADLKVRKDIGGIARRAALVRRLRGELESRGTTVWLIDAGDFSDGTPFSTEYHGEADIAAMNAAGYTFATLGNHEFNNPLARLKKLIGLFGFPVLCANVTETATGRQLVRPSEIRKVGQLKIGVFGLTSFESGTYAAAREGLTVERELETARRIATLLRRDADFVIAISHAGDQVDQQIAASVPGVDVIVGGHSHSRLPLGELVWRSDELKANEVNGTIIVQAHQWAGELGRLDLLFDKDERGVWHVDRYRERLIPITPDIAEDQKVAAIVDRYWKPISARFGEVIGQAAGDFVQRGDDMAPYNLFADAVREAFGTDIVLENVGGIRAPLVKGKITLANLIEMDPFGNTVVTFKITGLQLKEVLRRSRPAVSGLRYRIEDGKLADVTVAGKPVDDNRVYTGASNSHMAGAALKGITVMNSGKLRLDVVVEQIRKKGTVQPSYDGRRIVIGQPASGNSR